MSGGVRLPRNVNLVTNRVDERPRDEMYGAVEYAKDGLLPLTERLGPGPWRDRLDEPPTSSFPAVRSARRMARCPLLHSEEAEVNGQALQVLAQLYWLTGDPAHLDADRQILRAHREQPLPDTEWLPTRRWDFDRGESDSDVVQLRDHGNEIVAGLVELHLIDTALGAPSVATDRERIRALLDQLLKRSMPSRPNASAPP